MHVDWAAYSSTPKLAVFTIREDYFGYYNNIYHQDILQTIDDMLVEANPILFSDYTGDPNNFISIIHEAWRHFEMDPITYDLWENNVIDELYAVQENDWTENDKKAFIDR